MGSVILFYPKTGADEVCRVPLSVLAVASPLEKAGFIPKIIDARVEHDYKRMLRTSLNDAICVGISSMTGYQIYGGLEAARLIREKDPHIPIIWGGFHPTLLPSQTIKHHLVDIIVRGQGEVTITEVVRRLDKNLPLKDLLGITYKEGGKIIKTQNRPISDVNDFPPMAYHLVDVEKYLIHDISPRSLDYISSRGCPHRCGFCAISRFYERKWSGLKTKRVLDELEYLVDRYKVNGIKFEDDNFFTDKERVHKICKGMIERGLDIRWHASCRCEYLKGYDNDLLNLMKKSGCHTLAFGAESGSQKVLNAIKKDILVEDTLKSAEVCRLYGIRGAYSFMMGFPFETKDDLAQTMTLMDRLRSVNPDVEMNMFIYTPFPGTPLYDLAIKHGFREPKSLEEWSYFSHWKIVVPWIDKKYKRLLEELSYLSWFAFSLGLENRVKKKYFKLSVKILHKLSLLRWKYRFFEFPIEWELIKRLRPR